MHHVRSHDALYYNDTLAFVGQVFNDLPLDKEIRISVSLQFISSKLVNCYTLISNGH